MMGVKHRFEIANEKSGIVVPGLPILPHGTERYIVPGGGSRGFEIKIGDEISIVDREGLQLGELVFFAQNGVSDAGMIGANGQGRATNIISTLAKGDPSGLKVLKTLEHAGFDIKVADAVRIFDKGSRAGDTVDFFASSDGLLILAAPGEPMLPGSQNSSTELIVYIRRSAPGVLLSLIHI